MPCPCGRSRAGNELCKLVIRESVKQQVAHRTVSPSSYRSADFGNITQSGNVQAESLFMRDDRLMLTIFHTLRLMGEHVICRRSGPQADSQGFQSCPPALSRGYSDRPLNASKVLFGSSSRVLGQSYFVSTSRLNLVSARGRRGRSAPASA